MSKREIRNYLLLSISLLLFSLIFLLYFVRGAEAKIYGAICGQVIAEDTGKGIKDAFLFLYKVIRTDSERFVTAVTPDSNGNFCFEMVEPGRYIVICEPDPRTGYYCDTQWQFPLALHKPIITLERGKNIIGLKKVAKIGGTIAIKVLKNDGSRFVVPENKRLHLMGFSKNWGFINIPTCKDDEVALPGHFFTPPRKDFIIPVQRDESGNYLWRGIPPGTYRFDARIDGYAEKEVENVVIEKGKTTEVLFIIDFNDPTGVEGKVTSPLGVPISGVWVRAYKIVNNQVIVKGWGQVYSDASGYFSIVGLSPGEIKVIYGLWGEPETDKEMKTIVIQGKRIWLDLKIDISSSTGMTSEINQKIEEKGNILPIGSGGNSSIGPNLGEEGMTAYLSMGSGDGGTYGPRGLKNIYDCDGNEISPDTGKGGKLIGSLKKAIRHGSKGCLPPKMTNNLKKGVNKPFEIILGCPSDDCGATNAGIGRVIINIYGDPWSEGRKNPDVCGCVEGTLLHELLHLGVTTDECKAYV